MIKINRPNARTFIALRLGMFIIFFLSLFSCKPSKETRLVSLQSIQWLNGRWSSSEDGQFENYVTMEDNYIERVIYQIEDGQPVISERGKIFEKDASLAMTTTVFYTKQNEFSKYELLRQNLNEVIFRNIQMDEPYLISMQLMVNGKLVITETAHDGKYLKNYELTKYELP